jgi:SAM-dependent methyltransferase
VPLSPVETRFVRKAPRSLRRRTWRALALWAARGRWAAVLAARVAPFWLRQPLYRWTPGGYGHYRTLRRYARRGGRGEPLRTHRLRRKHTGASGLRAPDGHGIVTREYESYAEYVQHQALKFDELLQAGWSFDNRDVARMRLRLFRRFRRLIGVVPRDGTIVCAGARQGTEVEVLRDLGFRNAYGIDINPGPENELVRYGDFHHLENEDSSVDLVYSNALDHALDLDLFFAEHARVLKPDGYALYDIQMPYTPGHAAPYESTLWLRRETVVVRAVEHFERLVRVQETEPQWTWMLLQRPAGKQAQVIPLTPGPTAKPIRGARRRAPARDRLVAATVSAIGFLFLLLVFLPEELGDRPYDVFGLKF